MNRKQIRLNESQLNRIVKESVKKVLNEVNYINRMTPKRALAEFLDIRIKDIEGKDNDSLFYAHVGSNFETWYVFPSYEAAEEEARKIGPDFVEGATNDDYWYRAGFEKTNNGDFDWIDITNEIIEKKGPEWFFASYDGNSVDLPDGYVGFRAD